MTQSPLSEKNFPLPCRIKTFPLEIIAVFTYCWPRDLEISVFVLTITTTNSCLIVLLHSGHNIQGDSGVEKLRAVCLMEFQEANECLHS